MTNIQFSVYLDYKRIASCSDWHGAYCIFADFVTNIFNGCISDARIDEHGIWYAVKESKHSNLFQHYLELIVEE